LLRFGIANYTVRSKVKLVFIAISTLYSGIIQIVKFLRYEIKLN